MYLMGGLGTFILKNDPEGQCLNQRKGGKCKILGWYMNMKEEDYQEITNT